MWLTEYFATKKQMYGSLFPLYWCNDVPFDDDDDDEIAFNVLYAQESFVDWIKFVVDFV